METETFAAIICAAGSSSRMGGLKKEYQKIDPSKSLTALGACVCVFASVAAVEIIVIAIPENGEAAVRQALPPEFLTCQKPKILFVTGGNTRRASVLNALRVLAPYSPGYALIHDGARPWVSVSLVEKIIESVKKHSAVIPLLPLTDTPKECDIPLSEAPTQEVFVRNHLKRANSGIAQTPQCFKFPEILHAHEKAALESEEFTDDAEIWGKYFSPVAVVPGEPENKKITFIEDLG